MKTTEVYQDQGREALGYMLHSELSDETAAAVADFKQTLREQFDGDNLFLYPRESFHITLLDWLAPLVDYDRDKGSLVNAIKLYKYHPESVARMKDIPDVANPIVVDPDSEELRFRWKPEIERWLEERKGAGAGCPAHAMKVDVDGEQTSLVYYFWDKLVQAMYPLDESE